MANFNRDKKDNLIYISQTIDGKRFKTSTSLKVSEKDWKGNKAKTNVLKYKGTLVNKELTFLELCLNRAIVELSGIGGGMDKLKEIYINNTRGKRTIAPTGAFFLPYFKEYHEQLKLDEATNSRGYKDTYTKLEKYFGNATPTFSELDLNFYDKFNRYLVKQDLAVSTIGAHWMRIKNIIHIAFDRKLHTNKDFEKFERKSEASENLSLTQDEVNKIQAVKLTGVLDKVRDYFLIQCYTGIAFVDINKVTLDNVEEDNMLVFRREKSDEVSLVPMKPIVIDILNKYKGAMPEMMENQNYNKFIKEVCKKAKINGVFNKRITKGGKKVMVSKQRWEFVASHTARRTFATIQILEGTPINLIMYMTGHKTLDSFDKYIRLRELQSRKALGDIPYFKADNSKVATKIKKASNIVEVPDKTGGGPQSL